MIRFSCVPAVASRARALPRMRHPFISRPLGLNNFLNRFSYHFELCDHPSLESPAILPSVRSVLSVFDLHPSVPCHRTLWGSWRTWTTIILSTCFLISNTDRVIVITRYISSLGINSIRFCCVLLYMKFHVIRIDFWQEVCTFHSDTSYNEKKQLQLQHRSYSCFCSYL